MLTRYQFEKIKSIVEGSEPQGVLDSLDLTGAAESDIVAGLTVLAGQIAEFVDVSEKYRLAEPTSAIEFVVTALASTGKLKLTASLRSSLGLHAVPSAWHKPNPPTKYPALMTRWQEEAAKISEIASKINFLGLGGIENYRSATFEALGLGGILDIYDPASIPVTDPTMVLFREGATENLLALQPAWFDSDCQPLVRLPDGIEGRSLETANAEADWQKHLSRREAQRKANEARRAKEIAAIQQARAYAFAQFESQPGWKDFVDAALNAGFDESYKIIVADEPANIVTGTDRSTWLPAEFVKAIAKLEDVVKGTTNWVQLGEDFICAKIAAAQPTWFKQVQDGGFKMRPQPLKVREGFDRKTRSIHLGLLKLIRKFGAADVLKHLVWLKDQPLEAETEEEKNEGAGDDAAAK